MEQFNRRYAAGQSRTSLSDFMRRKALESAEVDVLNRVVITIPAKDWEERPSPSSIGAVFFIRQLLA
jgi:hypothetical protein